MTELRERYIVSRQELYKGVKPKPTTHRCKYCDKEYPQSKMGQIGDDVWMCKKCAMTDISGRPL